MKWGIVTSFGIFFLKGWFSWSLKLGEKESYKTYFPLLFFFKVGPLSDGATGDNDGEEKQYRLHHSHVNANKVLLAT